MPGQLISETTKRSTNQFTRGTTGTDGGEMLKVAAAPMLGLGVRTVYRLLEEGILPSVRIGRSWRIPAGALRDYLAGQTTAGGQPSNYRKGGEAGPIPARR